MSLIHNFTTNSSNLEGASCDQKFLEKSSIQIGYYNVMSLKRGWFLTKNSTEMFGYKRGKDHERQTKP